MSQEALNAICPYYTMYPLSFPLGVLSRNGSEGQVVIDPFCGRGTTNFAARMLGMPSYGIDSSPVAAALAAAKLARCAPGRVVERLQDILANSADPEIPKGEFWEWAFHRKTLVDICKLREELSSARNSDSTALLRAIALGALHGPTPKRTPSYFSNQAPRTFAPKPRYSVKFWKARDLKPPAVNMVEIVRTRAERFLRDVPQRAGGRVLHSDSRHASAFRQIPTPNWIITSPPYYGMRTYLQDQWLRNWFLGGPDTVDYSPPETQLNHSGVRIFASQLHAVWVNLSQISNSSTRLVVRFGGINTRKVRPMEILKLSLLNSGWKIATSRLIPDSDTGKRQARQFKHTPGKCVEEYDVYCRLA